MNSFPSVTGVITAIHSPADNRSNDLCSFLLDIQSADGPVSLLLTSSTYVYDCQHLKTGDSITAFYDPGAPVPLIYPPRYTALVIVRIENGLQAALDVFDETLTNSDGTLRLNPDKHTDTITPNGQKIQGSPGGHMLLVLFSSSTKSIPALAVPEDIVVFCG